MGRRAAGYTPTMTMARIRDLSGAQATLARRLDALERLVRRLRADRGTPDAARLDKLQEAVADLADAQHDAHLRLDALIDAVAPEAAGEETTGEAAGGEATRPPRPIAFETPSPRGWRSRLKAWARLVLRSTVGKARWIWDAAHPRPPWGDVLLTVRDPPASLPSLTVVLRDGDDGAWLDRQTDRDLQITRTDEITDGHPIDSDYAWHVEADLTTADLPATFLESARRLLATEALGFVYFTSPRAVYWLVSRELRQASGKLDLEALDRRAKRRPGEVLGKIAGGDSELLPRALCRPEIRRRVRRSGPYVVAVATKPRNVKHRLKRPRIEATRPRDEPRPGVLVLLTTALAGGLERAVAATLEELTSETPPVVASTVSQTGWRARWRALERSTPYVYALGGVFAEELHADLVHGLIVRHGVERVLLAAGERPALAEELRRHSSSLRIEELRPAAEPAATDGDGGRLRREIGWPGDALVIAMCADLIAEQRPEDFVALAHRLRDDERFRFLLVGDGPLTADLRDLGRLFGLENLRVERPERDLGEILDAADVVCTTAERDPYPYAVPAALGQGCPVVAAAGDLRRLLEAGPCGVVVAHPGDLDGFEAALRTLADGEKRRRLGERGPDAVRAFYATDDR